MKFHTRLTAAIGVFMSILAATVLVASCATPAGQPAPTPAEIAAQVCPATQTALTSLQGLVGLPEQAVTDLAIAAPIVNAVCSAGATVKTANLQSLATTAFPAIFAVVKASSLADDKKNEVIMGLTVAEIALNAVLAANPTLGATVVLPAATVAPAK
jgi:hypothetical protein